MVIFFLEVNGGLERAQWLRAFALAKDLGLVPSITHGS